MLLIKREYKVKVTVQFHDEELNENFSEPGWTLHSYENDEFYGNYSFRDDPENIHEI